MATTVYTVFAGELVHENRGGVERDYLPDTNGNVVGLIDNTQTVVARRTYWPSGEIASSSGTWTSPFGFGGVLGYFYDTLKSLYVRARTLRVDLVRWSTVDPLWPSEPAYQFVGGRYVDRVDPSGMREIDRSDACTNRLDECLRRADEWRNYLNSICDAVLSAVLKVCRSAPRILRKGCINKAIADWLTCTMV